MLTSELLIMYGTSIAMYVEQRGHIDWNVVFFPFGKKVAIKQFTFLLEFFSDYEWSRSPQPKWLTLLRGPYGGSHNGILIGAVLPFSCCVSVTNLFCSGFFSICLRLAPAREGQSIDSLWLR